MTQTILYIDYNPGDAIRVQQALESQGFDYIWAHNGEKGLEMAQICHPDLIMLYVVLPDISGFEVVRRLRASLDLKINTLPIIAVIAKVSYEMMSKYAHVAGCTECIEKPIDFDSLFLQVKRLVSKAVMSSPKIKCG